MRKCVIVNCPILSRLEKVAKNAIDVLNKSRSACSCYEAGKMRKRLQKALNEKNANSEKAFMDEMVSALNEIMEFLKDPKRSFRSEDFKKLANEISSSLQMICGEK